MTPNLYNSGKVSSFQFLFKSMITQGSRGSWRNYTPYSMFHVTWSTFNFNRNQLGTVSGFVMISVPCVINVPIKSSAKNHSPKNFKIGLRTTSKYWKLCSLTIEIVLQISDEISVLLIAALGFKWNLLWHWIFILDNHLSVHIRRAISHSHMTYAETFPS